MRVAGEAVVWSFPVTQGICTTGGAASDPIPTEGQNFRVRSINGSLTTQ